MAPARILTLYCTTANTESTSTHILAEKSAMDLQTMSSENKCGDILPCICHSLSNELEEPLLLLGEIESVHSEATRNATRDSPSNVLWSSKWNHVTGPLLLFLVSFLFSTQNVCMRILYSMPNPPSPPRVSAMRGWISLTFFLPLWQWNVHCNVTTTNNIEPTHNLSPPSSSSSSSPSSSLPSSPLCMAAAELAFWNFCSQAMFNMGLLSTPSARASFLAQMAIVMVPLISMCYGEAIRLWEGIGCLSSAIGLVILLSFQSEHDTEDAPHISQGMTTSSLPSHSTAIGVGDVEILLGAMSWSIYLIRISKYAPLYDEISLQATKNVYATVLYSIWLVLSMTLQEPPPAPPPRVNHTTNVHDDCHHNCHHHDSSWMLWLVLFYSALGPGILADLVQQKGQESVGATQSSLILSTQPILTAILARFVLGEQTTGMETIGGALLICGAIMSSRSKK